MIVTYAHGWDGTEVGFTNSVENRSLQECLIR
jgi:hypothetical protein